MYNFFITDRLENFLDNCKLEINKMGLSKAKVFKIVKNNNTYYIKIGKKGTITNEYIKLKWLNNKIKVPKIVLYDCNDDYEFIITEELVENVLNSEYYPNSPTQIIKVLKEAFYNLYKIDINECPFNESIDYKLLRLREYLEKNHVDDLKLKENTLKRFGSINNLLTYLENNKIEDEKCFSHGDFSLPNIFIYNGQFNGFIDLGSSGISDKWFDIAVCEKSIIRNFGKEYVEQFYDELEIIRDDEKVDYYLLLNEAKNLNKK